MGESVCILVYGSNALSLCPRAMVLDKAGFRVLSAADVREAETILQTQKIALVVLCHSLSPEKCEAALQVAKALDPMIKTLVLTSGNSTCTEDMATAVVSAFDGPGRMVETVRHLLDDVRRGSRRQLWPDGSSKSIEWFCV